MFRGRGPTHGRDPRDPSKRNPHTPTTVAGMQPTGMHSCSICVFPSVDINGTATVDSGNETTTTTTTTTTTIAPIPLLPIPNPNFLSWMNVQMVSQCGPAFTDLKQKYYWTHYIWIEVTRSTATVNSYYQRVEELYSHTSINVNAIEEHRECSDALDQAMEVLDTSETIAELALNMTSSDTITEAYSYAIQIPPLLQMINVLFRSTNADEKLKEIDRNVTQKCEWLREINERKEDDGIRQELEKLDELKSNTERQFKSVALFFNNLNNELSNKISIFTRKGQEYLDQRITKLKFSQEFASTHFLTYRENVAVLTDHLQLVIKDYMEELTLTAEKQKEIYKKIFEIGVPVINNYNVYQLNLVKNATEINDSTLQNITNGLQNNLEENMAALITETYKRLVQPFTEMKTNLLDPVDDILEQINDLEELLAEYRMSTKMNTHFFM